jgi:hypothetical protein
MSADNYLYVTKGKVLDRRLSDTYSEDDNTSGYLLFETQDPDKECSMDFFEEWAFDYMKHNVVEYGVEFDSSVDWIDDLS